ncbi:MAG: hypothetical protein MZW92_59290 [Comamonadaceae bacterium]|nr:hypothetical protein [Comamonadaceae bacterium]
MDPRAHPGIVNPGRRSGDAAHAHGLDRLVHRGHARASRRVRVTVAARAGSPPII